MGRADMFDRCPPAEFPSPPLSPGFASAADRFLPAIDLAFRVAFGRGLLDWQRDVIRVVTELDPRTGNLRWRQYLVLVPRQQGKTHLMAALALVWLLWQARSVVISVASNAEQARVLYRRTLDVVRSNRALGRRFRRSTDTRGLWTEAGGSYDVRAAKGSVIQGIPVALGVVDEVHIALLELWTALVAGTGGRDNAMVVGISTAGDETSELLHHLIQEARAGRIGLLWWRSPTPEVPADDAELAAQLLAASPSVAEGLVPVANLVEDVRTMPVPDIVRYRLNHHAAAENVYVSLSAWSLCQSESPEIPAPGKGVVFAVDRSPGWEYATVTASWRLDDGRTWTEVVASLTNPTPAALVEVAADLSGRFAPRAVVMDGYGLKSVAAELKLRGVPVTTASLADVAAASALFYANVVQQKIHHPGDQLLSVQLPGCRRKNVQGSESFRVTRASGAMSIDSVMSTILGCYFAETLPDLAPQLFV